MENVHEISQSGLSAALLVGICDAKQETSEDAMTTYWFPAKRHGWGWGFPTVWQGWVVLVVWGLVLVPGVRTLALRHDLRAGLFVAGWTLVLVLVCYWKGERPSWRWGDGG
jgi:hypothetical protein